MQKHIAVEDFPIKPEHINVENHFFEAFGSMETEISANWIVKFAQARGQGWAPFTCKEVNAFYQSYWREKKGRSEPPFSFNGLFMGRNDDWIVLGDDGRYRVTIQFICACVSASPTPSLFFAKTS